MKISFNNFQRQYNENKKDLDSALTRVAESGNYILGPEVKNFEDNFAKYIGSKFAIGVANGMEALQISLMALGIGKDDEVITTPHSAVATTLAITNIGAKPVFCDIDEYYHIDSSKIEALITTRTRAIVPVHLYGQSADLDEIGRVARKHNIHIIEDCAQGHGAMFRGKKVGSFGTFGCFSFYPTKNLGGMGDGGAITTDDKELAEKCKMLRNYGQKNRYEHEFQGMNSRLDEIQAALLSILLEKLDSHNLRRQKIAEIYINELSKIREIELPNTRADSNHVYHLFVIKSEKRDGLQKYLEDKGVQSLIHYPIPIHKQKCLSDYNSMNLPVVENIVTSILSLPSHPYLTD